MDRVGAIWLASYPKSGNTWLRLLLEAYRRNGLIDINDVRIGQSDGGATIMQGVSPMALGQLDWQSEMLLRPAALLNMFCRLNPPVLVKTHFANIQPDGLPPSIPPQFTDKAVYVVRDPRDVVLSFMRFFSFPLEKTLEAMNSIEFRIGGNERFATTLVSSWSNHVRSWAGEKTFPVHVVKYEDLLDDPGKELKEVLEFLELDVDDELIGKAVEATRLETLKKKEGDNGFRENPTKESFFGNGGSRWKTELGAKWVERIEKDHGDVMRLMEYL